MIQGAKNRVSDAAHWRLYRDAQQQNSSLLADLADEIRKYAAQLSEVNSTVAGDVILSNWNRRDEWNQLFGSDSSGLFGMVVWTTLYDDTAIWRMSMETSPEGTFRIYRRTSNGDAVVTVEGSETTFIH